MAWKTNLCALVSLREMLLLQSNKNQIAFMTTNQDKPPLFKSWTYWYVLVILFLVILIVLFYFFTKRFV